MSHSAITERQLRLVGLESHLKGCAQQKVQTDRETGTEVNK